MSVDTPEQTEAERRKEAKDVYESVIRTVDLNSGHRQPPLAKESSVLATLCNGRHSLDNINRAITAARANGDLFVAKTRDGTRYFGIDDEQQLVEKIGSHFSRVEDRREDIVGLANRRVQELRGGRDE